MTVRGRPLYRTDSQSLALGSDSQGPGQEELSWKALPVAWCGR